MEPQVRYTTTVDGASIAYATLGAGPAVIMPPTVHQFMGRFRLVPGHRRLIETLARDFTVVLYDGRGMGLSSRDRCEFDVDAKIRDLEAVSQAASADTFALFGWSFAGLTAMTYTALRPERVMCLVIQDSFVSGEQFYRESPMGRVLDALGVVTTEQWSTVTDMIGARSAPADAPGDAGRAIGALLRDTWDPEGFMEHRRRVREIDTFPELQAIASPTLVVATDGPQAMFEHSRQIASSIRSARLHRLEARWDGWDDLDYAVLSEFVAEHTPGGRHRARSHAPSATGSMRVVLFTDLVDHTLMMQRLGDTKGRDVLREHERITRDALKRHGGAEIKTGGDGFMMSFGSVTSAIDCAIAMQRAFAARNATTDEPLHVRIGLNAGEPVEEDGDLFGSTVIIASRIAAAAGAGEILIPEPLRHLLSGKSYVYADRGETMLKGFEDAVRLYEVRWRE